MERLKKPSASNTADGELVVRPDGREALRVRKRKRRTSQPIKDKIKRSQRARVVQMSIMLLVVFTLILGGGIAMVYVNSTSFRKGLVEKISESSGATAELRQFRMNPRTANAGQIALQWPAGNILKSLTLYGVSAEIFPTSFLGKIMVGEEFIASTGTLAIQIPTLGESIRNTPEPTGELPIHFNRYRIPQLDLTLNGRQNPLLRLSKAECSLYPGDLNNPAQLRISQGDLAIPGCPKLRLERALIEVSGDEAEIIGMRLTQNGDKSGSFELSGTLSPYEPDSLSTLNVELRAHEISGIGFPSLTTFINGKVDSVPAINSNYLSFMPAVDPGVALEVAFQNTTGSAITLQGLPFLSSLSQVLKDSWYQQPKFSANARGLIHREHGEVKLSELDLESKGHMAIQGTLSISADQTLSGELQVGIPEILINDSQSLRLKATFGPAREKYCWITLSISGSVTAPKDNFKALFLAAVVAPLDSPKPDASPGSTFDELTRPR